MATEQATERLNVRIQPSEVEMLRQLSEVSGLTMSTYVRQLIRREHARQFGRPAPKRATKRGRRQ